jgi:hypothetical protein
MADTPDTARLAEIRTYAHQTRRRAKGRHVGSDIIDELLDHIDTLTARAEKAERELTASRFWHDATVVQLHKVEAERNTLRALTGG